QILDPPFDPVRLVVSDHDDADQRLGRNLMQRPRMNTGPQPRDERITDVDIGEQRRGDPEREHVDGNVPGHGGHLESGAWSALPAVAAIFSALAPTSRRSAASRLNALYGLRR